MKENLTKLGKSLIYMALYIMYGAMMIILLDIAINNMDTLLQLAYVNLGILVPVLFILGFIVLIIKNQIK